MGPSRGAHTPLPTLRSLSQGRLTGRLGPRRLRARRPFRDRDAALDAVQERLKGTGWSPQLLMNCADCQRPEASGGEKSA